MCVKISNIEKNIIWMLLFLNATILLFGDFSSLLRYLNVAISLILLFVLLFNKKSRYRLSKYGFQVRWTFMIILLLLANGIYCILYHGVTIKFVFSQIYVYGVLLLFLPLIDLCERDDKNYDWIIKKLLFFGIIAIIVRIIVWFLFNFVGVDVFHNMAYEAGYEWVRNGRQRIPLPSLACIVFSYGLSEFLSEKNIQKQIKGILCVLVVLFYSFFVVDSRAMLLVLVASAIVMYLYQKRKLSRMLLRLCMLFVIAIFVFATTGILEKYISSIDAWSIIARQQAFEYYFDLFKENYIWGINLITESTDLQRGVGGNFFFADLGTISKFIEYGALIGFLFIVPLFRMIYISLKIKTNIKQKMFLFGITIYIITSCILSQDIYFFRNIILFPFAMCIMEFSSKRKRFN